MSLCLSLTLPRRLASSLVVTPLQARRAWAAWELSLDLDLMGCASLTALLDMPEPMPSACLRPESLWQHPGIDGLCMSEPWPSGKSSEIRGPTFISGE